MTVWTGRFDGGVLAARAARLVLVDRLADRWGVMRNDGFCVWFEVDRLQAA